MHDRKQLFQTEDQKLTTYEGLFDAQKSVSKTDLAYRFMNTRFLDLEKSQSTEKEWSEKLREYRQTKKRIEKQWHQNTLTDTAKLSFFGDAEHSNKEKEYYSTFTLEQMEVLIKNHERGGNSDEYNDVVTDLELYNLVSKKGESVSDDEKQTLLERLKQSTETYIKTRKPHFSSGKIRKAMILQIHDKVVAELTKYASAAQETATKEAYTTYNDAMASYKAMSKEKTPKGVASVCKALQDHVNVVSQVLQGTLALTKKQEKTLDDHLNRIIELVAKHEVEDNQSPCLSTRFFNALGWAQKTPVLTNADGLRRAVASSPIPKIMYHTIQAIGNPPEALPFGEQLAGSGPQYYSDGLYGTGTYVAYRSDNELIKDFDASLISWKYANNVENSIQISMCLNEHAHIVDKDEMTEKAKGLLKRFPKLHNVIAKHNEHYKYAPGYSYDNPYESGLSIYAALFGYNAINIPKSGKTTRRDGRDVKNAVGFALVFDRSAMTMDEVVSQYQINREVSKGGTLDGHVEKKLFDKPSSDKRTSQPTE